MSRLWRIWVSEEAIEAISRAAAAAHPNETGGVLVGVLTEGRPWVTAAVELPPASPRARFYEPPTGSRQAAVRRLRRRDGRVGYLGEWHSHPMDVPPSRTDAETMQLLGRTGDCPRPLLVIARRMGEDYDFDSNQWTGRRLRPVRVIAAGPLPSPTEGDEISRGWVRRPAFTARRRSR